MKILTALVAVLLVAGCGVRASGTIPGGPAPKVSAAGIALFFVSDAKVSLVLRQDPIPPGPAAAISLLVAGPSATERAAGLTTDISPKVAPVAVDLFNSYTVAIKIAVAPGDLSDLASEQLACTAIANLGPGHSNVYNAVLLGGDQQREASCSALQS